MSLGKAPMSLKRRDIEKALERKGFERTEGDHSFFIFYTQAGKKTTVRTKTSHGRGSEDIGDALISRMANQCKLTNGDFRQLVDRRLSRKNYEKKLKASKAV